MYHPTTGRYSVRIDSARYALTCLISVGARLPIITNGFGTLHRELEGNAKK
jgi:hypothetical protein